MHTHMQDWYKLRPAVRGCVWAVLAPCVGRQTQPARCCSSRMTQQGGERKLPFVYLWQITWLVNFESCALKLAAVTQLVHSVLNNNHSHCLWCHIVFLFLLSAVVSHESALWTTPSLFIHSSGIKNSSWIFVSLHNELKLCSGFELSLSIIFFFKQRVCWYMSGQSETKNRCTDDHKPRRNHVELRWLINKKKTSSQLIISVIFQTKM